MPFGLIMNLVSLDSKPDFLAWLDVPENVLSTIKERPIRDLSHPIELYGKYSI